MTAVQMGLTIAVCTAATMLTRFLPFVVFSSKDQQPPEDSCTTARLCMGRSADSEPEQDRPKNRCFATRSRKFFKKRCIL